MLVDECCLGDEEDLNEEEMEAGLQASVLKDHVSIPASDPQHKDNSKVELAVTTKIKEEKKQISVCAVQAVFRGAESRQKTSIIRRQQQLDAACAVQALVRGADSRQRATVLRNQQQEQTNRGCVEIWDTKMQRKIVGTAAPSAANLAQYLREYSDREVYHGQDSCNDIGIDAAEACTRKVRLPQGKRPRKVTSESRVTAVRQPVIHAISCPKADTTPEVMQVPSTVKEQKVTCNRCDHKQGCQCHMSTVSRTKPTCTQSVRRSPKDKCFDNFLWPQLEQMGWKVVCDVQNTDDKMYFPPDMDPQAIRAGVRRNCLNSRKQVVTAIRDSPQRFAGKYDEVISIYDHFLSDLLQSEEKQAADVDEEWLDSGHKWLSKRVIRVFGTQQIGAVVTGWMPANDEDQAFFHLQHDDGTCTTDFHV